MFCSVFTELFHEDYFSFTAIQMYTVKKPSHLFFFDKAVHVRIPCYVNMQITRHGLLLCDSCDRIQSSYMSDQDIMLNDQHGCMERNNLPYSNE